MSNTEAPKHVMGSARRRQEFSDSQKAVGPIDMHFPDLLDMDESLKSSNIPKPVNRSLPNTEVSQISPELKSFNEYVYSHTPREVREFLDKLPEEEKDRVAKARKESTQEMIEDVLNQMSFIEGASNYWGLGELTGREFDEERDWRWKAEMGKLYTPTIRSMAAESQRAWERMLEGIYSMYRRK